MLSITQYLLTLLKKFHAYSRNFKIDTDFDDINPDNNFLSTTTLKNSNISQKRNSIDLPI